MVSRRVFVVWDNPIFRDSMLVLLRHPEVECVGAAKNDRAAVDAILQKEPDTILVEEIEGKVWGTILDLFERPGFDGRLVSLNLRDNHLYVYQRQEWIAKQVDDLLHLILA